MEYYIGVDLGGTNIVAGLVDENASILRKDSVRTNCPRSPESICDDIAMLCTRLLEDSDVTMEEIEWVGVGSPGIIRGNTVIFANNLSFRNVRLGELLEERIRKRALIQNDGNAAAYGEFLAGAGMGCRSVIAITLGTGVGSGIILDNRIYAGFNGAAGELGHTAVVAAGGRACSCGMDGCLEAYCSATALRKITAEAMREDKDSLMWELCGRDIAKVSARTPFQAAKQGDASGRKIVGDFLLHLSVGVSNAIIFLQPELVCIGGGVSREGDAIIRPLCELVEKRTGAAGERYRTKIVASKLDSDAGLIGAALLGRQDTYSRLNV